MCLREAVCARQSSLHKGASDSPRVLRNTSRQRAHQRVLTMANDDDELYHDEVEIEDFEYDKETGFFTYPCPCGDLFTVTKVRLMML